MDGRRSSGMIMAAASDSKESLQNPHGGVAYALDQRRRKALQEIDEAPFGWAHVKIVAVAGVGFMSDAYDIFAISIAATMLGYLYGSAGGTAKRHLSPTQDLTLKIATPAGTLVGQLVFGWLADIVGRKRMYGYELIIITVAAFSQALAGHAEGLDIINVLAFWRFVMGVGIGGDYPLSAVIASEFSSTRSRGRVMSAVFAFQGWGTFLAAIVAFIVVTAFKSQLLKDNPSNLAAIEPMWRLLIGLGCIPSVAAMYFRLTISETPRFTMDIERNVQQADRDIQGFLANGSRFLDPDAVITRTGAPTATRRDFAAYFGKWDNFKVLFGTSWSWFALDIAFYGLGLNSPIVLGAIGWAGSEEGPGSPEKVWDKLHKLCIGNIVLSVAGLIPGYWVSFLFIDKIGRKPIQYNGFAVLTIIFCIMGFAYDQLTKTTSAARYAFVFLYCLANFFQNFGPNATTFIVPGEAFPTRYRSTCHGISAASGKLGAIISQAGFAHLKDRGGTNAWMKHLFQIYAIFMLTGLASTWLIPETNQRTLEDISNEGQKEFAVGPSQNFERHNTAEMVERRPTLPPPSPARAGTLERQSTAPPSIVRTPSEPCSTAYLKYTGSVHSRNSLGEPFVRRTPAPRVTRVNYHLAALAAKV